jgi:GDP-mannose 4,6-dehydratase
MQVKKKSILITGITGMVGSHLADYYLNNTDYIIVGMCRWRSPTDNISHLLDLANKKDRLILEYGDLNDLYSLQTILQTHHFEYISHLAAQSFPQTSFLAPADTYNTNIIGTENLLRAILMSSSSDAKIHICSSSEVFGRVPQEFVPINEECRFHPASPYAISKVGTDLIGRFYAESYDMSIFITRMFTHTGPRRGDIFAESTFAKQIAMIESDLSEPVIKVGNLDSMRTFADVRDAVRAYFMLLESTDRLSGEAFNIGGSHSCTIGDMLNFLIDHSSSSKKITIQEDPSRLRPIDADLQIPDLKKFKNRIPWEPEYPFEQTMLDLLNYWRDRISKHGAFLDR